MGLFRSDYFFCCANECIKQVEFNTIAASFGCLTSQLVRAYKYWNLVVSYCLRKHLSIFKLSLTAMLLFNSAGWHDGNSKRIITQVSSITSIIIQPDDTGTGLVLVKVLVSKGGGNLVNLSFVSRYILGEADRRHMLANLPDNKALEVGLKNGTSSLKCFPFSIKVVRYTFSLCVQGLAGALVEAWRLYSVPSSVILFIIEDVTYNICDQKFHEFEIR